MKATLPVLLLTAVLTLAAGAADTPATSAIPSFNNPAARPNEPIVFDETFQFLFFATLEGLYRDGVSDADVKALLARRDEKSGYLNFIYTCPICMPVEAAIETYGKRPNINHMKTRNHQTEERTFGWGLTQATSEALGSAKASVRLGAVNELVGKWIAYRMDHSSLTDDQRKALLEKLKKGREEGMKALRNFANNANGPDSMKSFAAGYEGGEECAICNAAMQMPLKLREQ